ncbi:MAG: hypothetical protein QOJ42_3211 [Acidobacteriaceae bacterium]|nr:hypothetical protein [Acidobacteriaceae bacterium]
MAPFGSYPAEQGYRSQILPNRWDSSELGRGAWAYEAKCQPPTAPQFQRFFLNDALDRPFGIFLGILLEDRFERLRSVFHETLKNTNFWRPNEHAIFCLYSPQI